MTHDDEPVSTDFPLGVRVHGLRAGPLPGDGRSICSDFWDDADASVAFQEMNFQAYSHYRTSFSYFNYDGPYWSSEFDC